MGRRSSVSRDPAIREAVDEALKRGCTIDEIVAQLAAMGASISRSAVGRYTKDYAAIADRQRDMQAVAKTFAKEFGGPDDLQGRLMIQLVTSLITRTIMPLAGQDEIEITGKTLADLGRAVKDVTSAAKIDVEREAKIREEERKKAKAEAADDAEAAARDAGASDETIRMVRMRILGMAR